MRALLLAAAILLPLAAGCFGPRTDGRDDAPPVTPSPAPATGRVLAYHALAPDAVRPAWTVFAVRDDGTAERLSFLDDGHATLRQATGVDYPAGDAQAFFTHAMAADADRSGGALLVRVERGVVDAASLERLRGVAEAWPRPGAEDAAPGGGDPVASLYVRRYADGREAVLRAPPMRPELRPVAGAFQQAEAAFRVETSVGPGASGEEGPCPRLGLTLDQEAFEAGRTLKVTASLLNCGETALVLGQDACGPYPVWEVVLAVRSRLYALPADGAEEAARPADAACAGQARPVPVQPGETATLVRRWNGTLAECDADGACRHADAPPDGVALLARVSGHPEAAQRPVTVLPRDAPRTRLLLVKEHDWVNGTADEPLMGHFGPHCAPVRYTLSPPSVTLLTSGPAQPVALVVRDFRDSPRPANTVTVSADRLDVLWLDPDATLRSPFPPDAPLAEVALDGEDFVVDGTRLPPEATHVVRATRTVEARGGAYEVASVLVFRHVGLVPVAAQAPGGCL